MTPTTNHLWEVMSTARTIRRFTEQPVDVDTLMRCLDAARWAPSGANAQAWRFIVLVAELRSVVAAAAELALEVIEPVYGMVRPASSDDSRRARTNRATYELHDRAGEFTSVLFVQQHFPTASDLLLGGSIYPAMQNFLLAARGQGLGPADELGIVRRRAVVPEALHALADWTLQAWSLSAGRAGRHAGLLRRAALGYVVDRRRHMTPPGPRVGRFAGRGQQLAALEVEAGREGERTAIAVTSSRPRSLAGSIAPMAVTG